MVSAPLCVCGTLIYPLPVPEPPLCRSLTVEHSERGTAPLSVVGFGSPIDPAARSG